MKKLYFIVIFLFAVNGMAQIVNIPDPMLKYALVNTVCADFTGSNSSTGDVDTNDNGEIEETEASVVLGLNVSFAGITSMEGIQSFTNLTILRCNNNSITSLDLSFFVDSMYMLDVSSNPLTSLLLPDIWITYIYIDDTDLTTVELRCSSSVDAEISISNNPYLTSINAKNGRFENTEGQLTLSAHNNPVLQYICVDDYSQWISGPEYWQIEAQNWQAAVNNDPNVQVTTYCNFAPGGQFNMVSGNVALDCAGTNIDTDNVAISITQNSETGSTFSNTLGNYFYYAALGPVILTPVINSLYFTVTPSNFTYDFTNYGNEIGADFCIAPNGSHNDVEVSIIELAAPRPGFDAIYKVTCRNIATEPASGTLSFTYNKALTDFVSAFPDATSTTSGSVSFTFSNLMPLETIEYTLILNVNSPTETPPVNIDDVLVCHANATITATDENLSDNDFTLTQTVIGSYDPNDKAVHKQQITTSETGEFLNYVIRFQNTGNFYAENVIVKDLLSDQLDLTSLEITSASHLYRATLTDGNKLEFIFEGINLPAVGDDEPGSHGYVAFRIKPEASVGLGDVIENTADIYFDYNFPIVTNTVTTTVTALATAENIFSDAVKIYPNPAANGFTVASAANQINSISIFNMLGQLVRTIVAESNSEFLNIDITSLNTGSYLIEIKTSAGTVKKKLLKL